MRVGELRYWAVSRRWWRSCDHPSEHGSIHRQKAAAPPLPEGAVNAGDVQSDRLTGRLHCPPRRGLLRKQAARRSRGNTRPAQSPASCRSSQETAVADRLCGPGRESRWAGLGERNARLAERVGFEPTEPVKVQRFSRPPLSTAQPPLLGGMAGPGTRHAA